MISLGPDNDHDDKELQDYADHSGDDYNEDYSDDYLEKDPIPRLCSLPKKIGRCRAALPRYYYHKVAQECVPFKYGGCRGNRNRFITKEKRYNGPKNARYELTRVCLSINAFTQ